jgi:hypothetical protein
LQRHLQQTVLDLPEIRILSLSGGNVLILAIQDLNLHSKFVSPSINIFIYSRDLVQTILLLRNFKYIITEKCTNQVRNALGSWKTIIDWNNNQIQWQHIVNLYEYQKTQGLTLANKLTKQHIKFEKNPMKVKYAVQLLSQSVANALLTMKELKITNFEDVQATVDYVKMFDSMFDVMNSRHLKQSFGKAPLQEQNEEEWKSLFTKCTAYICNLKTVDGKSVLHSERYASFLGIDRFH